MKSLFPLIAIGTILPAGAAILINPSITGSSGAFSDSFPASNVFNGDSADYATAGQGDATFLEFNFGAPTSFDSIVVVNRASGAGGDWIKNYTLTYGPIVGSTTITRTALQGAGGIDSLGGTVTTTTVRLDVDTLGSGSGLGANTGAMEIYFLRTPDGMTVIPGVITTASATPFSGYSASSAVNGLIGFGDVIDYASAGQGVDTFVDFDLGSLQKVAGFEFFDRMTEKVTSFDIIYSQDAIFGNGDDITKSYTGSTQSAEFAAIDARYARYDVTGASSPNAGLSEIRFFAIPEPAAALLGSLGLLTLLRRRRA